ncbi:Ig-like domain-containing protein [Streptomyces massasporeus]
MQNTLENKKAATGYLRRIAGLSNDGAPPWPGGLLVTQTVDEKRLLVTPWRCAMRKTALTAVAVSAGLLAIPAFSSVPPSDQPNPSRHMAAQQAAAPASETTTECPDGDTFSWVDCTDSIFLLKPGDRISVRTSSDSDVFSADFALVDTYSPDKEISSAEGVGDKWRYLWANRSKDRDQSVLLQASPVEPWDDGQTIKADVRVEVEPLNAYATVIQVAKNRSVVVKVVKDLTRGKPPIWIADWEKPRHGKIFLENQRKEFRYKPDKNFTGSDEIWYKVKNRRGETDTGILEFVVR